MLIADSGSTKTDWRLVDDKRNISIRTEGLNPYLVSGEEIRQKLLLELKPQLNEAPGEIHFYGAGCGTDEKKKIVREALEAVFPGAEVLVNDDLLGAARALCGREQGIAVILGTGSNSCCFDGEKIAERRPSLGYILGDEGGGAALGKMLLRKYLYDEIDAALKSNFEKRFELRQPEILDHIYRQPFPNRFLASFSKFIFQNIENPQCSEMVIENFRAFFKYHVLRYEKVKSLKMHVTGSVGFYFSNLLRRVAEEQNISLGVIAETPIAGLVNFHLER